MIDLESLNKIDIFMYIKFLELKQVKEVTTDFDHVCEKVFHEVTERILPIIDDRNLSIYIKTIA